MSDEDQRRLVSDKGLNVSINLIDPAFNYEDEFSSFKEAYLSRTVSEINIGQDAEQSGLGSMTPEQIQLA